MASHDLLTTAEGRSAINLPDPESPNESVDAELQLFITGISGRVDELCGPVVQRAIANERHSGGRDKLLLRKQHVAAITAASEWQNFAETVLTVGTHALAGDVMLVRGDQDVYAWAVRRRGSSRICFPDGDDNVFISYTAGRFASTAAVGDTFKLAATAVLRRAWKREQSSWAQAPDFFPDTENPTPSLAFFKAIDPMLCEFLANELLPPVGM